MGKINKSFQKSRNRVKSIPSNYIRAHKKQRQNDDNEKNPEQSAPITKRPYISAYKRAELEYQRITEERKKEAEERRKEAERRSRAQEEYLSIKGRMNKALLRCTKKGQPKLDAQMQVLLEKIEHRYKKEQEQKKLTASSSSR